MAPDDADNSDEYSVFGPGETVEEPGQDQRESSSLDVPEPKYQHEEWLYQQYAIFGKTLQEIADDCSVREKTIWRWVQKFNIDTRPGGASPGAVEGRRVVSNPVHRSEEVHLRQIAWRTLEVV